MTRDTDAALMNYGTVTKLYVVIKCDANDVLDRVF